MHQLARELGCNVSNICKWEKSRRYPQVIWIYRLAEVLEVNPEELVRVEK